VEEKPNSPPHPEMSHPERRSQSRYAADHDATVLLVNHGSSIPAHLLELSLGGCRLRMARQFRAGIQIRVELAFKINGIALRLSGVTQWTDGRQIVGIHFLQMSSRRTSELADVLAEMEADRAEEEAKELVDGPAAEQSAAKSPVVQTIPAEARAAAGVERWAPVEEKPVEPKPVALKLADVASRRIPGTAAPIPAKVKAPLTQPVEVSRLEVVRPTARASIPGVVDGAAVLQDGGESNPQSVAAPHSSKRERRQQARHSVDTTASIYFIDVAARATGRILDVSMGGCRIRTDARFPVGIYRRVETEFRIDGLPFRLGGVVQSVHDKFTVGIRFLNLSERKADQLSQLMEEIDEMRQEGSFESRQTQPSGQN